ncbi:uncharacterized protein LOC119503976 [Sebastes umbrosus]|uniref:uncharacterized protein LOC119503976 n=1 Tax=Sebastes umbrosus TaxID=72105 RepID=UPI00189CA06E|nr:uncharacterized protein LOC119503976 [Sebastes umbrosus]XP_037651993.1 uncharacterized protein LOC119503976 [Sebastes umbrosus]
MVKLNAKHPTLLLDEILHSIFFLGKLNDPEFYPESIVGNDDDVDMLKMLRKCFPRPFALYSSHLPKRSPFSCFLDMIVHLCERKDDEKEIIKRLQDFISQLEYSKSKALVSSTICVSQSNNPKSVKYYGVSMSTSGCYPGRIMVAASCLSSWDSNVADAVMTYYPTKTKKQDFDGTIKLPQHVRCQAFNLHLGREKPPCRSCGNLFGLETSETTQSDYGNCAEAESLSDLLKDVENVREQVRPTSKTCTDENRETVKKSVLTQLKRLLRDLKFKWDNDENFYDPRV